MASVLVVDDEPTILYALETLITYAGHEVRTAPNGLAALDMLQTGSPPDLILVDLFMPIMNGTGLIERLRADPSLTAIPVILVTGALVSTDDFPPAGSYQALIRKPFNVRDVLSAMNKVLRLGVEE